MNMPILRAQMDAVQRALLRSPAVALQGPRQCGKTTLAKSLGGAYFDLERPEDRLRLDANWDAVAEAQQLVILDEAHTVPELYPLLRSEIDRDMERKGRYLLLGSISPALMRNVTQSLMGCLALVELTPFLLHELPQQTARHLWLMGGFPKGGALNPEDFGDWQNGYLTMLAERDLPAWGLPSRPKKTKHLLSALGEAHGSIWNASQVGSALGLSYHTINSYLDILEGAFLVRRLMPFASSKRKRTFKRPKIHLRDSGLLHSLLNVASLEDLHVNIQAGRSWKGFVIEQILGALAAKGRRPRAYYWRTSHDAREIDLVLDFGREKWAVHSVLTTDPSDQAFAALDAGADIIGAKQRILVSQSESVVEAEDKVSCDLEWLTAKIAAQEM